MMSTIPSQGCCAPVHGFVLRQAFLVAALLLLSVSAIGSVRAGDPVRDNLNWIPEAEVSLPSTVLAEPDRVRESPESAQTWTLSKIAVIQAAYGDVMGAKNTVALIGDKHGTGDSKVTSVWIVNGQPVYDRPPVGGLSLPPKAVSPASYRPGYNYDGSIVPGFWLENGQPVNDRLCACLPSPDMLSCDPCGQADPCVGSEDAREQATRRAEQVGSQSPGWGGRDSQGNQYFLTCDRAPDHVPSSVPSGLPSDYLARDPRHGAVVDFTDDNDGQGIHLTSRRYADGYVLIETLRSNRR
jgi:hypothetical protein